MPGQLTVRVPKELEARLARVARRQRKNRSEIVRLALEQFLSGPPVQVGSRPIDLVRDLLGAVESGVPDLGQRHRQHLLSRLRHGR